MSSRVETMTWSQPWALAIAAFSSDPTVPMTVAPSAFSHWQAISPTPDGGGVEQDRLAGLHRVGPADQVLGSHALEHDGRRRPVRHPVRDRHQHAGRDQAALGIRAGPAAGIGHPVAGLHDRDAGADRLDDPGPLAAQSGRQRQRVEPGAVVGVDVVGPDGCMAYAGLALAGLADLDVLPAHDLGAAGLDDADRFGHVGLSLSPSARITSCDRDA